MATGTEYKSAQAAPGSSLIEKAGPHAPKVILGAAVLGLVAVFLPAVTVSIFGVSESIAVVRDWRGKLGLLAYVGVGVTAGLMLKGELAAARSKVLACLIAAGVAVLLAVWLPLSVRGSGLGAAVTVGVGCYVNILAALGLAAGTALQARRAEVI